MVILLLIMLIILSGCCNDPVSLESLLIDMSQREAITYFPANDYRLFQASSYNRASLAPETDEWFANNDMSHFIRVEENLGRREFVMLDSEGPGAIVRWWMTFYKAQDGVIRIYIDNAPEPVAEGSPDTLLSGSLLAGYPFSASLQKGGPIGEDGRDYDHNFYLPIPFSKHCKITYECDSLRVLYNYEGINVPQGYYWPDVFYNICYRVYTTDTEVKSFSKETLSHSKRQLELTGQYLISERIETKKIISSEKRLLPGDSLILSDNLENSAVNWIQVELKAGNTSQTLRSTVFSARFDDHSTVWLPAGDFFGTGYTRQVHTTLMNKSDTTGSMHSFWVMPFRKNFSLSFINYGSDTADISVRAGLQNYIWNERSMYFGASWHEHYRIRTRDAGGHPFDLNFVTLEGKGVYAGDQITLYNNTFQWWGEGDEKIFVDGEKFPSSFGTGSEDYYGYSFGRQEAFSHPFLSQPVGTGNMSWGVTVNMRHRMLDAIPFRKSFDSRIELWHWADIKMNYALTSYYYFIPPVIQNVHPDPAGVINSVAVTREDFENLTDR